MPQVSIIVPVYNAEHKLERCINSIISQTFADFELILIDDGSKDKSGIICDNYAVGDNRITVIHQENLGASTARNKGIETATGNYIGFVDSDDYVAPTYLETLVNTAKNSNSDIAMCCFISVDKNGNSVSMCHGFSEGTVFDKSKINSVLYKNILDNKNTTGYFALWNKLFKRSLIMTNKIRINDNMSFGEDMLFVMDCLSACNNIAFTECLAYYYEMTESGLFSKYRRSFINDISLCYNNLIAQVAPESCGKSALIPLNLKYWGYVNRHIDGIVKNERFKLLLIISVFKDKTVRLIFSFMANLSEKQTTEIGISSNEIKPAKLVKKGLLLFAAFVADYQFNPKFWLRRLRK